MSTQSPATEYPATEYAVYKSNDFFYVVTLETGFCEIQDLESRLEIYTCDSLIEAVDFVEETLEDLIEV